MADRGALSGAPVSAATGIQPRGRGLSSSQRKYRSLALVPLAVRAGGAGRPGAGTWPPRSTSRTSGPPSTSAPGRRRARAANCARGARSPWTTTSRTRPGERRRTVRPGPVATFTGLTDAVGTLGCTPAPLGRGTSRISEPSSAGTFPLPARCRTGGDTAGRSASFDARRRLCFRSRPSPRRSTVSPQSFDLDALLALKAQAQDRAQRRRRVLNLPPSLCTQWRVRTGPSVCASPERKSARCPCWSSWSGRWRSRRCRGRRAGSA